MLTEKEKYRYSRHLLLNQIGEPGQEKLKAAKVLVIGAGGLGCPVLQYLTAAGVGTIGIIDFDVVDETNLQRQVLFSINDIGENKAIIAKKRLQQLNSLIQFNVYHERLTTKNALQLFKLYDLIIDGSDNFSTRYLVNDACVLTGKPLVYGSIYKFEGQISVFNYQNGPTYRCLFPEPPEAGSMPSCSEVGVLGVLPGIIGSQQANEALKIILGIGDPLSGKLLVYNSLNSDYIKLEINKREEECQKVSNEKSFEEFDYDFFCGITNQVEIDEINLDDFKQILHNAEFQIVDVRESWEQPRLESSQLINIPLGQVNELYENLDKTRKIVVFCQHGIRSLHAIEILKQNGITNLINLKGGIANWNN